ncbi:MAG: VWA domain-containing protein [Gammaproteobacteria bacterium]|nr:VWA domain-containing protein [Gammaproteobacteria bacterium]
MAELHFLRPFWLLALLPLVLAVLLLIRQKGQAGSWQKVCDPGLIPFVIRPGQSGNGPLRLAWLGLSALLAILALAGPAWKKIPQPVFSDSNALIIALDLSLSMDATDVSPSRLGRAMFELQDILTARDAGRGETGLLVYAGEAFAVTPLTDDTDTISNLLKALSSDLMPSRGSHTLKALELAEQLLAGSSPGSAHILLVTDSAEYDTDKVVRALRHKGIRTSVLAMGTAAGGPIPTGKGFVTRHDGQIVIPTLDLRNLSRVANDGGGLLVRGQAPGNDITQFVKWLESQAESESGDSKELEADLWREEGPWLLVVLLPLVILSFRRGIMMVMILVIWLPAPQVRADESSLWLSPDQRAARLLESGDVANAASLFQDPRWKAVANYRNGDFQAAAKALEDRHDAISQYNRGNALARAGDFQGAIDAYTGALELDPRDDDARHNKELIEQQLQQGQGNNRDGEQSGDQGDSAQSGGQSQDSQAAQDSDSQQTGQQQAPSDDTDPAQSDQQQGQGERGEGEQSPMDAMSQAQKDEAAQATEQWLQRIPDDPGGLLRRKFYYQHQQKPQDLPNQDEEFW